ncbi:MAG: RNA polymerase subunit sigma-70 [Clostridium sp.]
MDRYEKEKIKEFRIKGFGYKKIGKLLGFSRDKVRGFCKDNNLLGDREVVHLNIDELKRNGQICTNCGKTLNQKTKGRKKRFCSSICKDEWWNKNRDEVFKLRCLNCKCGFESNSGKQKYCSHKCCIEKRFKEKKNGV